MDLGLRVSELDLGAGQDWVAGPCTSWTYRTASALVGARP